MATQTPAEVSNVLKAYAFRLYYSGKPLGSVGAIARNRDEALAKVKKSYVAPEYSFFGSAFAVMQPALIEWWQERPKFELIRQEGFYAFLEGMFFGTCGDHEVISHCGKEETTNGWYATIYHGSHRVITKKS